MNKDKALLNIITAEKEKDWKAIAEKQDKLLHRVDSWFKANYSYIYEDEDTVQLWADIEDELEKGVTQCLKKQL